MHWPRTKGQKVPRMGHFWSRRRGPFRGWECRRDERLHLWVCSKAARAGPALLVSSTPDSSLVRSTLSRSLQEEIAHPENSARKAALLGVTQLKRGGPMV